MKRLLILLFILSAVAILTSDAARLQISKVPATVTTLTATGNVTFESQFTLNLADPAIIFDGSTASDTDFWFGLTADEVGDDNDDLQIGKGTTKGTTPFFTWDQDGGFIAQNLTDAATGYQFLDSDGGTPILNVDTTNERIGILDSTPTSALTIGGDADGSLLVQTTTDPRFSVSASGLVVMNSSGSHTQIGGSGNLGARLNISTLNNGGNVALALTGVASPAANLFEINSIGDLSGDLLVVDQNGNVGIANTAPGGLLTIGSGTKHDGFVIRDAAELQTTTVDQQTLDSFTLPDNNIYGVTARVAAFEDGINRAYYEIKVCVYRDGGGATLQGGVTSVITSESEAAWDATFTVDTNDIRISVTGEAATTIEWSSTMSYMNVGP